MLGRSAGHLVGVQRKEDLLVYLDILIELILPRQLIIILLTFTLAHER